MYQKNLIIKEADYMIEKNATIREVATIFNRSKSSVHKDLTVRLPKINQTKFLIINQILETHRQTRHFLGGYATRKKFQKTK